MKKVMVFGSFDVIHPGHVHMLKEAKAYGDFLIVVIARDQIAAQVKKKTLKNNEMVRLNNLKKLELADKVILGSLGHDRYQVIREEDPDIVALGYDQRVFVDKLADNIRDDAYIVRLEAYKPEVYKTSKIID